MKRPCPPQAYHPPSNQKLSPTPLFHLAKPPLPCFLFEVPQGQLHCSCVLEKTSHLLLFFSNSDLYLRLIRTRNFIPKYIPKFQESHGASIVYNREKYTSLRSSHITKSDVTYLSHSYTNVFPSSVVFPLCIHFPSS